MIIDARQQISATLKTVCTNVKMSRPDGIVTLPLICYSMDDDTYINIAYDRLVWKIGVYAETVEALIELVADVDKKMTQLGYTRTSMSADDEARVDTGLYLKRLMYSALVNKESMSVVAGSK